MEENFVSGSRHSEWVLFFFLTQRNHTHKRKQKKKNQAPTTNTESTTGLRNLGNAEGCAKLAQTIVVTKVLLTQCCILGTHFPHC